jgi:hypothetical protein
MCLGFEEVLLTPMPKAGLTPMPKAGGGYWVWGWGLCWGFEEVLLTPMPKAGLTPLPKAGSSYVSWVWGMWFFIVFSFFFLSFMCCFSCAKI